MKVGLVPLLYDEYNYGGVLQFYALQHVLKENDIECNIIFFDNEEKVCDTSVRKQNKFVLQLKVAVYKQLNKKNRDNLERIMQPRKKKIDLFKKNYYSLVVDSRNVLFSEYDAIVCGSDQIWNPAWARKRSFLEFVPDDTNKVIYAASLGVEKMSENEMELFKPRIERLQHVSVREYSAKLLLDKFVENVDIDVVLDPTLLLSPNDWDKITNQVQYKDYILTYFLGEYSDKTEYIRNIAHKLGLKIINIPFASGERIDNVIFGDIQIVDADPGDFIGLIKNASYVFTDSFHACVFSVLFKTDFYAFKRDGKSTMLGRINTLLSNFNLANRIIDTNFDIECMEPVDYSNNEKLHEELKKKSLEFLLENIKR